MRRPRPIAHQRVRTMAILCMALIALGTLLNAAAMFAAIAVPDGGGYFDAFTAIHVGSLLVAASAAAIVRPAFFTFAGATALGGAIGGSEERRVGQECGRTGRSRGSPVH